MKHMIIETLCNQVYDTPTWKTMMYWLLDQTILWSWGVCFTFMEAHGLGPWKIFKFLCKINLTNNYILGYYWNSKDKLKSCIYSQIYVMYFNSNTYFCNARQWLKDIPNFLRILGHMLKIISRWNFNFLSCYL